MHLAQNSFKTNIEVGRTVFHSIKPGANDAIYKLTLYHSNKTDDNLPDEEKQDGIDQESMFKFNSTPFLLPKATRYVDQPSDSRSTRSQTVLHRAIIAFS